MTPDQPTDERGAVSGVLLQRVADDAAANRTSLAVQAEYLQGLRESSNRTATATQTLAALAKSRAHNESEDRAMIREDAAAAAAQAAKTQERLVAWFSDNWRYLGIVGLLIFYPQVVDQIRALGMLPTTPTPAAVSVTPAPAVAPPAAMSGPVDAPGMSRTERDDGP